MNMGIVAVTIAGIAGLLLGYLIRLHNSRKQADSVEAQARASLRQAEEEARKIRREAEEQARRGVEKEREELERSTRERRRELVALEERLTQREDNLDRKVDLLDKREYKLNQMSEKQQAMTVELADRQARADSLLKSCEKRLERLAGMTREQARREQLGRIEKELQGETGVMLRRLQQQAREDAQREARRVVSLAIQRYSASHACEMMTSTVPLPNDDVKGRIIGREGRNIRAIESLTGVNMLIDDTPEAVVISSFDPLRREIARLSLEKLIADGRIHPARIEEIVDKTREELDNTLREAGEEAIYDVRLQGTVDPELAYNLGRLKFRTSYSQNVLLHSLEVARLMSVMAPEVGLDPALARRIGLLHDIGKALDHENDGGHATIGADLLKRLGEEDIVVEAVGGHHQEAGSESLYAVLCAAADAISSSRPGARVEATKVYVQRLENLESIANAFPGVIKTFAIQAGRELRVIVDPDRMNDDEAMALARDIGRRIEQGMSFPGQIRVVVIREKRCIEYAR